VLASFVFSQLFSLVSIPWFFRIFYITKVKAGGDRDQRTHARALKNLLVAVIEKSTWRISCQQYIAFQSLSTSQTPVTSLQPTGQNKMDE
jgi:hypothetical protein